MSRPVPWLALLAAGGLVPLLLVLIYLLAPSEPVRTLNPGAAVEIHLEPEPVFRRTAAGHTDRTTAVTRHGPPLSVHAVDRGTAEAWRQAMHELVHVHELRTGRRDPELWATLRALSTPTWDAAACGGTVTPNP